MNKMWYQRRTLVLFVFLILSLIFLFAGRKISLGNTQSSKYAVYSIRFEYFGMDAPFIEKLITIPLEERIGGMNDLLEMRSSVEYGKSVTTVYFNKKINSRNTYLAIRDAVDTLYNELPGAVQKPRIYSASNDDKPVLSFAVTGLADLNTVRTYIDDDLKPELESIDGVADIIVSGGTSKEILVEFDVNKIASSHLNTQAFSSLIQDANVIYPGGTLKQETENISIQFDTRLSDIEDIKDLPIKVGDEYSRLVYFSDISFKPRTEDEIVRINGSLAVTVQVKKTFSGNSIDISKECRKILEQSELSSSDYQILQDSGEVMSERIKSVLIALGLSFFAIILTVPLFYNSLKVTVLLLFLLPVTALWSLSQLAIFGFCIDQNILAGLTIALGLVADAALVISESTEKCNEFLSFTEKTKQLIPSMISSSFTTVLVLIPLFFMDQIIPGVKNIAVIIVLMIINSTIISIVFLPSFLFEKSENKKKRSVPRVVNKWIGRLSFRTTKACLRYKYCSGLIYCAFLVIPFVLFFMIGKNISLDEEDSIIYAVVEYEPEINKSVIDSEINDLLKYINKFSGVTYVISDSQKGSCEINVGFNHEITDRYVLAEKMGKLGNLIPDGFLYTPENGISDGKKSQQIEIAILGDDYSKCREYAKEVSSVLAVKPFIVQTVLNFKNPEKQVLIKPDKEYLAKSGLSVEDVSSSLRWALFGPVVDKWIQDGKETDIRVVGKGTNEISFSELENLYIPIQDSIIQLRNIGSISEEEGSGKLFRLNKRKCAYITVHSNCNSAEEAMESIRSCLKGIQFEKGYGYQFSMEIENMQQQYYILFLAFIGAIIAILLLLTGLTEKFSASIRIISIIPISVSIPLLIKFFMNTPLELGDVVGMVAISGIGVNNSIYLFESKFSSVAFKVRDKVRSILVTSLTSIISSVPLLFLDTGVFAKELAFFMIAGIAGSVLTSFLLFPMLLQGKRKLV